MGIVVEATQVTKRYGTFTAVDGVSFYVRRGECYGLLGPNGAGKTSIIRMMYGMSPLTSGVMRLFGLDIEKKWREIRGRIGVCQQDNTLDPDLSVEDNLAVYAGYYSIPAAKVRERAEELLALFALERKRKAKVLELSGGLARRLMVARSLINEPELLILDEPTTGLDPQSRHLLWERIKALQRGGVTLILTTHYMEEAAYLCDRVMIIDYGRILVEGEPCSLVKGHVGDMAIEFEETDEVLKAYLEEEGLPYEVLDGRMVVYAGKGDAETLVRRFQLCGYTMRPATLEDVFLRLTGRGLRD